MALAVHFADRILARVRAASPLVLGLDPDFDRLPPELQPAAANAEAVSRALVAFTEAVLEAAAPFVAAVKPQSAFFEQFGSAGVAALAQCLAAIRRADLPVLLDVKRGDIGSTSAAYAKAYLDGEVILPGARAVSSDLAADAITVNPFLGTDTLEPFVAAAARSGKGLFVLVKTSNPGARELMDLETPEGTVSERLARFVAAGAERTAGASGYGLLGAVVGSTYPHQAERLRALLPHALILVPGLGAQGGSIDAIRAAADARGEGILVPVSRGLTYPSAEEIGSAGSFVAAVRANAERFAGELQNLR